MRQARHARVLFVCLVLFYNKGGVLFFLSTPDVY